MSSRKIGSVIVVFAGLASAVTPAAAEVFFRPFFRPFAYTYHDDDYPDIEDEAPARYASRRAVAAILGREGFRLVGPLGRRGEQIVATGVSRREGEMRFVIDPFAGRIIRGLRLSAPPPRAVPEPDDDYVPPLGGSRPVVRQLDRDSDEHTERSRRRSARLPDATDEPRETRREPRARALTPRPETPPSAAVAPPPPVATPAPQANVRPSEQPTEKPARVVYPEPAPTPAIAPVPPKAAAPTIPPAPTATQIPRAVANPVAKPVAVARTPATPAMPKTAPDAGGTSHRAIVPPTTPTSASAATASH